MKNQILLVCLTPTMPLKSINEYMLYQIFHPKLQVKNVRIFSRDKFIKAFVLVESNPDIEQVVEDFHQKQLNVGWLKVYVSHKQYVAFDLTIEEIIAMGEGDKVKESFDKTTALTNKSLPKNQYNSVLQSREAILTHKSLDMQLTEKQQTLKEKMPKTAKDLNKKGNIYFNYNDLGKKKNPLLRFSHDIEIAKEEQVRASKESYHKNNDEKKSQLRVKIQSVCGKCRCWFSEYNITTSKSQFGFTTVFYILCRHIYGIALDYFDIAICFYKILLAIMNGLIAPHRSAFMRNFHLVHIISGQNSSTRVFGFITIKKSCSVNNYSSTLLSM